MKGYGKGKRLLALGMLCVLMAGCQKRDRLSEYMDEYEQEERELEEPLGQMVAEQTNQQLPVPTAELDAPADMQSGSPVEETPKQITETPEKQLRTISFETYYGTSNQARCHNIQRAAELLNGVIIEPGETFSCSQSIGPITEENGYQPAGTYVAGKVEEGIGGGVCQISSTLYNAALLAGITVVERASHSMVVSYIEPARDAAIAGDYKDLKLRNDFDTPVMIEAKAGDGTLRFVLHTWEEADVEISLESVVISKTEPGEPVITVDESQSEEYYKVTQQAHTGYVAELYQIISRDGVEISREKVNTSTYEAVPEYVTVGRKPE